MRMIREMFDRTRNFIANKEMTLNGDPLAVGDVFDKTQVTTRRLRQLYDGRWIKIVGELDVANPPTTPAPQQVPDTPSGRVRLNKRQAG